jgi:SAM-dependent methyltransferase
VRDNADVTIIERTAHWDEVFTRTAGQGVSWFEAEPATSLTAISALPTDIRSVVDVGGGASALVDVLLDAGIADVTVLDVSGAGLEHAKARLGERADSVSWVVSDVTSWVPERTFDVWHDRAVFHFLVDESDRAAYRQVLESALHAGSFAVVATFAPDGPTSCSSLPVARYDAAELIAALGPGFEVVDTARRVHVTPSGSEQPFTWVVLRRAEGSAA